MEGDTLADDVVQSSRSPNEVVQPQTRGGYEVVPSSEEVVSPFAPTLPVAAPEAVQKWLRSEDWEALTKAWAEAEAQAIAWAEGSDGEEAGYWEEPQSSMVLSSPSKSSLPKLKTQRRRPQWDPDFSLLGNDHRKPPPLRRYFDRVPSENTLPKGLRGDGQQSHTSSTSTFEPSQSMKSRKPWENSWEQTVSLDNEALHPHLRHYFDRRGLESSYRNRPEVDRVTKRMRCRTPHRPSTRERILKFRGSASEPSLSPGGQEKDPDTMHWGARCRLYNSADYKVKPRCVNGVTQRVPWVQDHHVSVASDNEILNPALRHYFECDGIESSFRNRGIHYGRPHRTIFGATPGRKMTSTYTESSSGWTSVRSSILSRLSLSSLIDDGTPSGLPGIRTSSGLVTGGANSPGPHVTQETSTEPVDA